MGIFFKDKEPKTKKEIIRARNKKHNQINLLADAQQREAENLQELGGVFLDSDKNMQGSLDEKRRQDTLARLAARRSSLKSSQAVAAGRWKVAATTSGAFISR